MAKQKKQKEQGVDVNKAPVTWFNGEITLESDVRPVRASSNETSYFYYDKSRTTKILKKAKRSDLLDKFENTFNNFKFCNKRDDQGIKKLGLKNTATVIINNDTFIEDFTSEWKINGSDARFGLAEVKSDCGKYTLYMPVKFAENGYHTSVPKCISGPAFEIKAEEEPKKQASIKDVGRNMLFFRMDQAAKNGDTDAFEAALLEANEQQAAAIQPNA